MSLTIRPPPPVASDLSSTYQCTTCYYRGSGAVSYSTVSATFPSPVLPPVFLVLARLQCQNTSRFSLSHPSHGSTLSLGISLTGPYTVCVLPHSYMPLPYAPSLLRSGDATAERNPRVATTLTGTVLPPHDEPPLVIGHNGEG